MQPGLLLLLSPAASFVPSFSSSSLSPYSPILTYSFPKYQLILGHLAWCAAGILGWFLEILQKSHSFLAARPSPGASFQPSSSDSFSFFCLFPLVLFFLSFLSLSCSALIISPLLFSQFALFVVLLLLVCLLEYIVTIFRLSSIWRPFVVSSNVLYTDGSKLNSSLRCGYLGADCLVSWPSRPAF